MSNESLRGGQPKPRRGREPIPVSMPHSATHLLQGACLQTKTLFYCQQNLRGGGTHNAHRRAVFSGLLEFVGQTGQCSENSWARHWGLGGQIQGLGSQQGAWEPPRRQVSEPPGSSAGGQ